ncbi:MAG: hypothetical protein U0992_00685 [Planctomycetaceae bacterium]
MLTQTVEGLGIDPPWEHAILTVSDMSSATAAAWSPVGAGATAGGEKKLWLPGSSGLWSMASLPVVAIDGLC